MAAVASRVASASAWMMRAGLPTAVAPGGTGLTTTALEPTRAPSPTVKPPSTCELAPTITPRPSVGWRLAPFVERRAAERDALVDRAVVADLGRLADHDAHAVVDEDAPADLRARMDLDAGEEARQVRDEAPHPVQAVRPAPVRAGDAARARAGPDNRSAPPTSNAPPGRARGCRRCLRAGARTWRWASWAVTSEAVRTRQGALSAMRCIAARCRAGCAPLPRVSRARLASWLQPRHQLLGRGRVEEAERLERRLPVRRAAPAPRPRRRGGRRASRAGTPKPPSAWRQS